MKKVFIGFLLGIAARFVFNSAAQINVVTETKSKAEWQKRLDLVAGDVFQVRVNGQNQAAWTIPAGKKVTAYIQVTAQVEDAP